MQMNERQSPEAGAVLTDEWTRLKKLAKEQNIDALLRELRNSMESHQRVRGKEVVFTVRGQAAWRLGQLRDPRAVGSLSDLLHDSQASVRTEAARALGSIGDKNAIPALIEALNDVYGGVRMRAAQSLGRLGDRSAGPGLVATLQDETPWVRMEAAKALVQIRYRDAIPSLRHAVRHEGFRHPYRSLRIGVALASLRMRTRE
jgi:HEAT repeat protein